MKYPEINVKLAGQDGNAFAILGRVRGALKKHKVPSEEIAKFLDEAKSDDYDHLLQTCMNWVNCDDEE